MFSVAGRTIRGWMASYDIKRLGPSHLRKGLCAAWNLGLKQSEESKEKNRIAHLGRTPHNKGVGRVTFTCEVCGTAVFDKPYRRRLVCSNECRDKRNAILRGESHWNYKGEIAGYAQRKRNWSEYRQWRRAVMVAGDFTCVACGKLGGRLSAHHLNSWTTHPEQRLDVNNGVCICWPCHWRFHRECGHKHTTAAMFANWLTK